jgi:hypothetical protein
MRSLQQPANKELERTRSSHFAAGPRRSIQCWTDLSRVRVNGRDR